jgi:hypothetical protein
MKPRIEDPLQKSTWRRRWWWGRREEEGARNIEKKGGGRQEGPRSSRSSKYFASSLNFFAKCYTSDIFFFSFGFVDITLTIQS